MPIDANATSCLDSNTRHEEKEKQNVVVPTDEAVSIVVSKPDHLFELDEDALEKLLLQDEIKDRYAVIVSVAGAFRKGKSFLLDFFLRYLKSKYGSPLTHRDDQWMGHKDAPLKGFPWRGGSERDTTGILMWSEIFLTDLPNGDKAAIIVLDTQGTFDSESTVRDCATVFALSTMISSIQVYNMSQNIQEDDLQHLQLFTEYGRLALEDTGKKPFQKLQFLVRDWSYPYEADYGAEGGRKILDRRLKIANKQHPEHQSIRKHISSCFSDISCFLMPHPGLRVATKRSFDGRLSDIEPEFQSSIKKLAPMLLSPENLVVKEIGGHKIKVKELLQYFKSYINIYSGDELPEPKSMLVATAEANNLAAVATSKELYSSLMENLCGGGKPYLKTAQLENEHLCIKDQAMEQFRNKRKMGGEEFSETYRAKLEADLNDLFEQFKLHNESKNIFKAARTPAVLFTLSIAFYMLSGFFGLLGIYSLANLCNLVMIFSILSLSFWLYVRYSGEMLELSENLDVLADSLWEYAMKPLYVTLIEKGTEQAVQETSKFIGTALLASKKDKQS